jgi:hypothetical protein
LKDPGAVEPAFGPILEIPPDASALARAIEI